MWKWIGGLVLIPIFLVILVAMIGAMLPREHEASCDALIAALPDQVAATIRDVEAQPRWRSGVTAVELVERRADRVRYIERSGDDAVTFELVEERPGERFRSTIIDENLPYGGFWIITVQPEGGGTRVRIHERGYVRNPVFRFVSAIILGHDSTMKSYLNDLGRSAGR